VIIKVTFTQRAYRNTDRSLHCIRFFFNSLTHSGGGVALWVNWLGHHIHAYSGAHPASYPMDTGVFSLTVKWLGHEADHLPLSSAEIKNAWRYTSTPHMS